MSRANSPAVAALPVFPLLAVLLCTLGVVAVVVVSLARPVQPALASGVQPPASDELDLEREALEWRVSHLQQSRDKTEADLNDARLKLSHLEDHLRRLAEQAERLRAALVELDKGLPSKQHEREAAEQELERLKSEIRVAETQIADAKRAAANKPVSYSVVPYEGSSHTNRRPLFIECRGDSVVLQPEGIAFTEADFEGPMGPGNPLAAAMRASREYFASLQPDQIQKQEPYPLLIVRPDGITAYYLAQAALKSWGSQFGYELVSADWKLKYPDPDPRLGATLREVVVEARIRQQALIAAAPRRYRNHEKQSFHVKPQGGIEVDKPSRSAQGREGNPYREAANAARGGGGRGGGGRGAGGRGSGGNALTGNGPAGNGSAGNGSGSSLAGGGPGGSIPGGGSPGGVAGSRGSGGLAGSGMGADQLAANDPSGGNGLGSGRYGPGDRETGSTLGGFGAGGTGGGRSSSGTGTGGTGTVSGGSGGIGAGGLGGTGRSNGSGGPEGGDNDSAPSGNGASDSRGGARTGGGGGSNGADSASGGGAGQGSAGTAGRPSGDGGLDGGSNAANSAAAGQSGGFGQDSTGSSDQRSASAADQSNGLGQSSTNPNARPGGAASDQRRTSEGIVTPDGKSPYATSAPDDGETTTAGKQGAVNGNSDTTRGGPAGRGGGGVAGKGTKGSQRTGGANLKMGSAQGEKGGKGAGTAEHFQDSSPGSSSSANSSSSSNGGSSQSNGTPGNGGNDSSQSNTVSLMPPIFQKPQQSLAKSRGRDWGVPETTDKAVAVSRPVIVECHGDRLSIMTDDGKYVAKEIPLTANTADSVDELVANVQEHMKGWGLAGRGLYWKPMLVMRVPPDGRARFKDLESLLADSGYELQESKRAAAAPEAKAPAKYDPRRMFRK